MKNGEQPAFPVEGGEYEGKFIGAQTGHTSGFFGGLTKREYFAAMAMQGILSGANHYPDIGKGDEHTANMTTGLAIKMADELLKQLENS